MFGSKVLGVAPAALYAGLVFVLGSLSVAPSLVSHASDKLWHALAFGLMQCFNYRALRSVWPDWHSRRAVWVAWLTTTGVGGLLEAWQSLLVYRSSEWGDAIANASGALLVALVQSVWGRPRERPAAEPQ